MYGKHTSFLFKLLLLLQKQKNIYVLKIKLCSSDRRNKNHEFTFL